MDKSYVPERVYNWTGSWFLLGRGLTYNLVNYNLCSEFKELNWLVENYRNM